MVHLGLFGWSFRDTRNASPGIWFLRILLLSMTYDNLAQGLGGYLAESSLYEPMHRLRYLAHAVFLPGLVLFAQGMLSRAGVALGDHPSVRLGCGLFTFLAIAWGCYHEVLLLEVVSSEVLGVSKLVSASATPPFATIITNLFVLLMGAVLWRGASWPWMFLGALFIFLINVAATGLEWRFVLGNFAEIVFIFTLLATERHVRPHD
jgi:hypothetical protein